MSTGYLADCPLNLGLSGVSSLGSGYTFLALNSTEAVFLRGIISGGTCWQHVSLLVTLTLIIWLRWCLPDFHGGVVISLFLMIKYLEGRYLRLCNILLFLKLLPLVLTSVNDSCLNQLLL